MSRLQQEGSESCASKIRKRVVFDGETGLHLAIAFGDMELVENLLSLGADLCSRAYGSSFAPGVSRTYFGEYPLSLAAAMGSVEVAEIMLRHYSKQTTAVLDDQQDIISIVTFHNVTAISRQGPELVVSDSR